MNEQQTTTPQIFGHRGACGYVFENSFESFNKALDLGADGLESDCWLLQDNQIVLHHDKAITIDQPEPLNISKMNLADIKAIDLPNGGKIPTLEEFCNEYGSKKTYSGKMPLFSFDLQDLKVGAEMIPILEKYDVLSRTYLCGSTPMTLKRVRKISSEALLVGSNIESYLSAENLAEDGKIGRLNLFAINSEVKNLDLSIHTLLNQFNLKYFVWNVNSKEDMEKLMPFHPYALYSDYPDKAREWLMNWN